MNIINANRIINDKVKDEMVNGYEIKEPFPFKIIDNFFTDEILDKIMDDVQELKTKHADYVFYDSSWEKNKYAFTKYYNLKPLLLGIFKYLNSNEFINYLEKLTGINDIIREDISLQGAGIHRILNDGFLNIHSDFNSYYSDKYGKLDRRINLLIYLNPDWKDEYNGHLLLCDNKTNEVKYKIKPILNRCVIFNTSKHSLHGHPEPLCLPEGRVRESIAVYYYTMRKGNVDFEGDDDRPTLIYPTEIFDKKNERII